MYVGQDFSPSDVGESELYTLDFVNDVSSAVFVGSASGSTLTVTQMVSGVISVGQVLQGPGVAAGTQISSVASGTFGGVGAYGLSVSQFLPSQQMLAQEQLTGATWSCAVEDPEDGSDPSPGSHVNGSATFLGTMTTQRISGLLAGVRYTLVAAVTTTMGNTKSLWSHVQGGQPT